mmetsp:Transcript_17640/g.36606  ORF Transcript_17640/g.36606 Transcript_17640/m.36606 type:complete len:102 (-) Transcript_17640:578-883(-)
MPTSMHARDLKLFGMPTDRLPTEPNLRVAYETRINNIRQQGGREQAVKFQEASIAYTRLTSAMKAAPTLQSSSSSSSPSSSSSSSFSSSSFSSPPLSASPE